MPVIITTTYTVLFWDIHKDRQISRKCRTGEEAATLMNTLKKAGHSNVHVEMKHNKRKIR